MADVGLAPTWPEAVAMVAAAAAVSFAGSAPARPEASRL